MYGDVLQTAFFAALGVIASSVERLAIEIRHLQRTEVLEAEEYFAPGQKGSVWAWEYSLPSCSKEPCSAPTKTA